MSYRIPNPINEPIRSYAPGTSERKALKSRLAAMSTETIEIPLVIGGREVRTGDTGTQIPGALALLAPAAPTPGAPPPNPGPGPGPGQPPAPGAPPPGGPPPGGPPPLPVLLGIADFLINIDRPFDAEAIRRAVRRADEVAQARL